MLKPLAILVAAAALAATVGCRIDDHKNGKDDNVKISTPFGGMSVKTNEAVVEGGVGLTVYPGSVIRRKDKDNGAADINMSFGSFHLGVKAVSYTTGDAPEAVTAFYRKDMAHFGTVILCHGSHAVGMPDKTADGLTCSSDHGSNIHAGAGDSDSELKAGSRQHQHIVAIGRDGSQTKIGLIALDLPSHLGNDDTDRD